MIDLRKYSSEKKTIVPIVNHRFKYKGKQYGLHYDGDTYPDGWYEVVIQGNYVKSWAEVNIEIQPVLYPTIKGYVHNNNLIFKNYDEGRRKLNKDIMVPLFFNRLPSFSSVVAIIWEDNQLYYFHPNYEDYFIYEVKRILENDPGNFKSLKGLTPELKTLALFHTLEQERLEKVKKEAEAEELRKTLQGRLVLSLRRVGAELLHYTETGNRLIVDWMLDGQKFNSVLDKETFSVIEAGICVSSEDRKHNLHSIVLTAKDYQRDNLIYKTRE